MITIIYSKKLNKIKVERRDGVKILFSTIKLGAYKLCPILILRIDVVRQRKNTTNIVTKIIHINLYLY